LAFRGKKYGSKNRGSKEKKKNSKSLSKSEGLGEKSKKNGKLPGKKPLTLRKSEKEKRVADGVSKVSEQVGGAEQP